MAWQLADALQHLGARRVEATLVAALLQKGPMDTKVLLAETGLRQPEVSVGMRELRGRGWVSTQSIPRTGKGRPMYRYGLAIDEAQVYAYYHELGLKSMQRLRDALAIVAPKE